MWYSGGRHDAAVTCEALILMSRRLEKQVDTVLQGPKNKSSSKVEATAGDTVQ